MVESFHEKGKFQPPVASSWPQSVPSIFKASHEEKRRSLKQIICTCSEFSIQPYLFIAFDNVAVTLPLSYNEHSWNAC